MSDFYFGYGSNLDWDDWSVFCGQRGFDPHVLRPVGAATLPDERLVFDYRSLRRRCGVLNIRPHKGGRVEGYLFTLPSDGWKALDVKEGHPLAYKRETTTVLDSTGASVVAQTYRVIPEQRRSFCAPNEAYLAACRAGRARFGLSNAQLEAAAANRMPDEVDRQLSL